MKQLVFFGLSLLLLHLNQQPCEASSIVFEDDFSEGLEKWQPIRDNGQFWSVENGQAKVSISYHFTITELVPKDIYWNPAWQDLEYSFTMRPIKGVDRNASFNVRSLWNWFEVHLLNTFFNVVSIRDGRTALNTFHPLEMKNGETYQIKIRFEKGTTTVFINGSQVSQDTDQSFVDQYGKIGLKGSTGSVAPTVIYFDDVHVALLDAPPIKVTTLKQTNPTWTKAIYDHAQEWDTEPTIGRWGCALTSLAMVMNAHHLDRLPNGEKVTPLSLNEWLKAQPDGYLYQGLVNWLAASRLSKLISDKYGSPALEYAGFTTNALDIAHQQLRQSLPVILEIPGHFLVGGALTGDEQDITIHDPAYTYQTFSQHKQPLLSTRTLTPSHTDLSYLLITAPVGVTVSITTDNQERPLELTSETTSITAFGSMTRTKPVALHTYAKPSTATYHVQLKSANLDTTEIKVLTYQKNGDATIHKINTLLGPISTTFDLQYMKEQPSQISITEQPFQHLSPLLFWLRSYLNVDYFNQITVLEHQIAEVRDSTTEAKNSTIVAVRDQLRQTLSSQPNRLIEYVMSFFPQR